jgi:hypothetical protein
MSTYQEKQSALSFAVLPHMKIPSLTLLCCLSTVAPLVFAQAAQPDFGPNVTIFDPSMPGSAIQSAFDAVQATQAPPVAGQSYTSGTGQFNTVRHAFLFKPGSYSNIQAFIGYYTSVAGLGISPDDVTINGTINSIGVGPTNNPADQADGLSNFWRSIENMHLVWQSFPFEEWTTSQACPMRRMHISDNLFFLSPYLTSGFTSGGFIADSVFDIQVISSSQQQWITRNSVLNGGWSNGVWNQVFVGVTGAPTQNFPPSSSNANPYTTIATSPVTREKPFLYVGGNGNFNVFVPALQKNSSGVTWANGPAAGSSIPISDFYIAKPTDSAAVINLALAFGKNLILTPGVYKLDRPLNILWPNTVVLGLGFPTLVPTRGNLVMDVANVPGVKLSGLLFDAGTINSPTLLQIGLLPPLPILRSIGSDPNNPTMIQDVFFRIGGANVGKATVSLEVNSSNVIIDNSWVWRADHGNPGTVGWTINTAKHGVIINGDNVVAYGLAVEHFQEYQTIWSGENGTDYFYQSEMPYDPPTQADFSHQGINGFASFKVEDRIRNFRGFGFGVYCNFTADPAIVAASGIEAPNTPGVQFSDLLTVALGVGDVGSIENVINDVGGPTSLTAVTPTYLLSYP